MQLVRRKALPLVVSLVMALTVLVGLPATSHAAASAQIDISTIDGGDTIGGALQLTGSGAGEAEWEYDPIDKRLYLRGAPGDRYTLTGTNDDLIVTNFQDVFVFPGLTIILDDISIGSSSFYYPTLKFYDVTLELVAGPSNILAEGYLALSGTTTITGGGTLTAPNMTLGHNAVLNVEGAGLFCMNDSVGVTVSNNVTINISSGSSFEAQGSLYGIWGTPSAMSLTINSNGYLSAIGDSEHGIHLGGTGLLTLDGTGSVVVKGAAGAFHAAEPIFIGDRVFLSMYNASVTPVTYEFQAIGAVGDRQWVLGGNAVLSGGDPRGASVGVTVPAGGSSGSYLNRIPYICENTDNGLKFAYLQDAFGEVDDGETVRLLTDVTLLNHLTINNGKTFTFDTDSKTLDFDRNSLIVSNGSKVSFVGCTKLENYSFISVLNNDTSAKFDSDLVFPHGYLYAYGQVQVTISGSVTGSDYVTVYASTGARVTIEGDIVARDTAISAYTGSTVTVNGGIEAGYNGVYTSGGATITVNSDIFANENGIFINTWDDPSTATVITVNGDIFAGYAGVLTWQCEDSVVNIYGNIEAGYIGVFAFGEVVVLVDGSITVIHDAPRLSDDILVGVAAGLGAEVTVEGTITVATENYVALYFAYDPGALVGTGDLVYECLPASADVATSRTGYLEYNDLDDYSESPSFIWVKDTTAPGTGGNTGGGSGTTPDTGGNSMPDTNDNAVPGTASNTLPSTGDDTAPKLLLVALLELVFGCGLVIAYRRHRQQV